MAKPAAKSLKSSGKLGTSKAEAEHKKTLWIEAMITNGGNQTQAAVAAGAAPGTAAQKYGYRMSKDVQVMSMLHDRQGQLAEKHRLTTDDTIAELAKIVRADLRKLFRDDGGLKEPGEWPDDIAGAVASIEVFEEYDGKGEDRKLIGYTKKLKLWDKNSAVEKAMKHLGMFEADNKQRTGYTELTDDALDRLIVKKAKEAGVSLH